MGRSILHMFMRAGWKKSSVMRLFCYLAHGLVMLAVVFLALMAESADPLVILTILVSVGVIGTQVLNRPLLEAVDRADDPLIAKSGWLLPACVILIVGMLLSLFFWQPENVRSAGIPYWSLALADVVFLTAVLLMAVVYLVLSAPPLDQPTTPAKL